VSSSEPRQDGDSPQRGYVRDLTTGSIPRHLVAFSLPMLAGNMLQVAYSLVNAVWVGRYLGPDALAAVTISQPVIFILIAVAGGLTLATNILVAQDAGAHAWDRLQRVVQTSYVLITAISFVLLALGLLNIDHLLALMKAPPNIYAASASYLRIVLWTLPFSFLIFLIGSILRGVGDSRTPMYFQTVSVIINAILDPVLIFGLLGAPKLGLNGTAWATLISQGIAVVALLIYVAAARPLVNPQWRRPRLDVTTAGLLVFLGIPTMVQQSVVSVSMLFIVRYVSAFGSTADAAFGAALRIDGVAFLPALTLGMAASTLAGQNIGAGKLERISEVFRWGTLLSGGISLVIMAVAMGVPWLLLRAFTTDPEVITIGTHYLRIVGLTYVFYAIMFVSNGVINGAGHTLVTTAISVVALLLVRLPLSGYLAHVMHHVTGVWYGMTLSVAVGMVLSVIYYSTGRWRQPISNISLTRWFPRPSGR